MAKVYIVTEEEMNSLIDSLKLKAMEEANHIRGQNLTADEQNRLDGVHRAFHYIVIRWAQSMGFSGVRGI